ncbi:MULTISPECIES: hypothetical protein [unclassified Micromonospora]|uniref:hypothetical protein n=1 Tax=unclassified Micromonospora TaxID=2617518 RepID=UPI003328964E
MTPTRHTGEPARVGPLLDPHALLHGTDWASLCHAYGSAEDTPSTLTKLMDDEPAVRADALQHLFNTVYHQNSIYPATVPTTLYLAAILSEPRAATTLVDERIGYRSAPPRPLRVLLLDWLGGIAEDVNDAVVAQLERVGFSLDGYPAMAELRAQRPVILQAVSAFLRDPDPATRHAAAIAAALLLDSPDLIRRADLPLLIRAASAETTDERHRDRATDILDACTTKTETATLPSAAPHQESQPTGRTTSGSPLTARSPS